MGLSLGIYLNYTNEAMLSANETTMRENTFLGNFMK